MRDCLIIEKNARELCKMLKLVGFYMCSYDSRYQYKMLNYMHTTTLMLHHLLRLAGEKHCNNNQLQRFSTVVTMVIQGKSRKGFAKSLEK